MEEKKTDFEMIKEKVLQLMRETVDFISGLAVGLLLYHFSVM